MSTATLWETPEFWDGIATVVEPPEPWEVLAEFTVEGKAEPRGSKHAMIQKRWRGDKSIVWRKGPEVIVEAGMPPLVFGDPMVLMTDDNRDSGAYMRLVTRAARAEYADRLTSAPIRLTVEFYFERPKKHYRTGQFANALRPDAPFVHLNKPDTSKLIRAVEDALTGAIYVDDCQIVAYGATTGKYWGPARTIIKVEAFLPDAPTATRVEAGKQREIW